MKIEDILRALPTKEDIASAVGLQARTSMTVDVATAFAIFSIGMVLGAGLALLFAPKTGQEIRHDLGEKLGEFRQHVRAQTQQPVTPAKSPST